MVLRGHSSQVLVQPGQRARGSVGDVVLHVGAAGSSSCSTTVRVLVLHGCWEATGGAVVTRIRGVRHSESLFVELLEHSIWLPHLVHEVVHFLLLRGNHLRSQQLGAVLGVLLEDGRVLLLLGRHLAHHKRLLEPRLVGLKLEDERLDLLQKNQSKSHQGSTVQVCFQVLCSLDHIQVQMDV